MFAVCKLTFRYHCSTFDLKKATVHPTTLFVDVLVVSCLNKNIKYT